MQRARDDTRAVQTATLRSDARRNREAVIEHAVRLLAERPQASMREIADASGLGRTTVYRHFPTREDLVRALFERVMAEGREATARIAPPEAPAAEVLRGLGPLLVEIGERYRFLDAHRALRDETLTLPATPTDDPLGRWAAAAQERGELRDDVPVAWFVASVKALAIAAVEEVIAGRVESTDAGRMLGATLLGAFGAPGP